MYTSLIYGTGIRLNAMAKGNVDFFNDTGGYGFIETDDADDDVFFHMEDVGGPDLEEGTDIEFDIEDAPKGPRASNVTRL
jgi:CspA family cold shock protein